MYIYLAINVAPSEDMNLSSPTRSEVQLILNILFFLICDFIIAYVMHSFQRYLKYIAKILTLVVSVVVVFVSIHLWPKLLFVSRE